LWNELIVAGMNDKDEPFLGFVDLYGSNYTEDILATGYGTYMAMPILRKQ